MHVAQPAASVGIARSMHKELLLRAERRIVGIAKGDWPSLPLVLLLAEIGVPGREPW